MMSQENVQQLRFVVDQTLTKNGNVASLLASRLGKIFLYILSSYAKEI